MNIAFKHLNIVNHSRVMALQRLIFGPDPKQSGLPSLMLFVFGIFASKRAKAQGYGLHSKEEGF